VEILLQLFAFVDTETLLRLCIVCKKFVLLSSDNSLWKPRAVSATIYDHDLSDNVIGEYGSWKKFYLQELMYMDFLLGERQIVIGRGSEGFYLNQEDERELRYSLNLPSFKHFQVREMPTSWRDIDALVFKISCGQARFMYSDLMIVKIPVDVHWRIRKHPFKGYEWIEELHRVWKADRSERSNRKLHTEVNYRKRKIVIDIGPQEGLELTNEAIKRLQQLCKCEDVNQLKTMPRDHPILLQVVHELGTVAGRNLRIVSVPIETEWFVESRSGIECVAESYRRWPQPTADEMNEVPFGKVITNKLVTNFLTPTQWDNTIVRQCAIEDPFATLTNQLEEGW